MQEEPARAGEQEAETGRADSVGRRPAVASTTGSPLKLLMVEDSADDARLITRALERGGYELELSLIKSERDLRSALAANEYDLVITDHDLPGFDSSDVLRAVAELAPDLPCVLVSGKVGEEAVGQAMHQGAVDYVAKDNLGRAAMVVERALAERRRERERNEAEAALKRSSLLFEAVFANARDGMLIFDDDRHVVDANPAAESLFALARSDLLGLEIENLVPDRLRVDASRRWERFVHAKELRGEIDLLRTDGSVVLAEYKAVPGFLSGRHLVVLRDIRAQRAAEQEVRRRSAQGQALAQLGEVALREQDLDRLMSCAAKSVAATLGVKATSILELREGDEHFVVRAEDGFDSDRIGAHVPHRAEVRSLESYTMGQEDAVLVPDYEDECRFDRTPTLEALGIRSALSVRIPGREAPFGMMGAGATTPNAFNADDANFLTAVAHLLSDAVERGRREVEARERGLFDPLTNLPNRALFFDRLASGLARATRASDRLAVLLVDIDGFAAYNAALGHESADRLLKGVSNRIVAAMREVDTVARFGGDEFVVLCESLADETEADALAGRLLSALQVPFSFDGEQHKLSVSVGVAAGDGTAESETLVRDADIALHVSKHEGGGRSTLSTETMRADVVERAARKRALERAVENGELRLHYQPIVALDGGKLCAVEALVRWDHPERGMVPPAQFIPLAEESGLIIHLGEWVLRAACAQAASWRSEFGEAAPLPIHINIAARQVAQPSLPKLVARILEETGVPARDLALELTETALIDNLGAPMTTLAELRAMGVRVVLDDFGTGYSSLSYLESFPIDTLKIDRSFVSPLGDPEAPDAIITAIVGMARALGVDTVGEGVETAEQAAAVTALGCKFAQGYFFGRPTSSDQLAELIRNDSPLRERAAEASALAAQALEAAVGADVEKLRMPSTVAEYRNSFLMALLAADSQAAQEVVGLAMADEIPLEAIDFQVIGPAMVEIGRLWERGVLSVAEEHMATAIASRAAGLAAGISNGDHKPTDWATGRNALLALVDGEEHVLGLRMVADVLQARGIQTRYLGRRLPNAELCSLAEQLQPDVIALSLARSGLGSRLEAQVAALRVVCPVSSFLIGGQGASSGLAERTGTTWVKDLEDLMGSFDSAETGLVSSW